MGAAQELENIQERQNWHWRNSMRVVRFIAFDARAALPLCVLLFRLADWRFWFLAIVNLLVFRYFERKGLTTPAALRNFRAWLVGKDRPGWVKAQNKKFHDYG